MDDFRLSNARHVLSPLQEYISGLKMLKRLSINGIKERIVFANRSNILLPSLKILDGHYQLSTVSRRTAHSSFAK